MYRRFTVFLVTLIARSQISPRFWLRRVFSHSYFREVGEPKTFKDIELVEFEASEFGTHFSVECGGPIWPDWETEHHSRHRKAFQLADRKPEASQDSLSEIETGVWIGPIVCSFGHHIAEFSSRLLVSKLHFPNTPFLFSVNSTSDIRNVEDAPAFFRQLLDWYDIPFSQVKIIRKATRVKDLKVFRAQECLNGPGPSSEYLSLLKNWGGKKLPLQKRQAYLFVSRQKTLSPLAGEAYISALLSKVGIPTFCPEDHSIEKQLETYARTDHLIFVEGSATIGLQLLGELSATISILVKQPRKRIAKYSLKPRAQALHYIEVTQDLLLTDITKKNAGLPLLNTDLLHTFLSELKPELCKLWDPIAFQTQVERDAIEWLTRSRPKICTKVIRAYNESVLKRHGLNHLSELFREPIPGVQLR